MNGGLFLVMIVVVLIVISALIAFSRLFTKNRWVPIGIVSFFVILIIIDVRMPHLYLDPYCKSQQEGSKVYEAVSNVDGFYVTSENGCNFTCKQHLRSKTHPYKFVEAHAWNKQASSYVSSPGLYRFSLEDWGHPNCSIFESLYKGKEYEQTARNSFQNKCVGTMPIESISAKYSFTKVKTHTKSTIKSIMYGWLYEEHKTINDLSRKIVLAESRNYSFVPEYFFGAAIMGPGWYICEQGHKPLWLHEILKPSKF